MKQTSTLFTSATEDELLISQTLLDLPNIINTQSKSQQHYFHFPQNTWSCKRRRSSLHLPAPSPVNLQKDEFEDKHQDNGGGATTGTPDTPLDFQSTESDEKSNKHCTKKTSNKRSKKQYNEMIKELTETNEVLKREVEIVRKYKDNLKDLNSKYKEMKMKVLKNGQSKEQSQKEIYQSGMNLGMQSTEQAREIRTVSYQQPLIENLMAQNYPYSLSPFSTQMYSSNNGLGWANRMGRFKLPDLNVSVEDAVVISQSQPLDVVKDGRTRYREARRMRRGLMKVKKIRNAYAMKLPQHY